jgi:hypothetical protein
MKGLLRQSEHYSYDEPKETMRKIYTDPEIESLAEDALNALCLFVQERIGQNDGGNASIFWSGREDIIADYVESELINMGNSTETHFHLWQKTRQFVPDLATVIPDFGGDEGTPALVYKNDLYLEFTNDESIGKYMLTIENTCKASNDLTELERELYEWGLNAGYFD